MGFALKLKFVMSRQPGQPLSKEDEARMRIMANLIIDRMLEDKAKGSLKFKDKKATLSY